MKKTTILWIILDLLFLIVFNVVFFLAGGFKHLSSGWISYGFIHFAYLMLLLTPKLVRPGKNAAVFGFPLYALSSMYFSIEFIAGIVFIVMALENYKILLLGQLVITVLYGVLLISNLLANEYTADASERRQSEIDYVKNASSRLKILLERTTDKGTKKKIERLYDAVYSSPVKSRPDVSPLEDHILQSINEIENAVSAGDNALISSLAGSLLNLVNERNTRLRAAGS